MQYAGSKYGAFLESYNKGNNVLDAAAQNFMERTDVDKRNIIEKDNGILKDKFMRIGDLMNDRDKSGYDKLTITGSILSDITSDIVASPDPEIKKSGISILKSFFEVARQTEDQQLLNTAVRIADSL